jgi:hypothetical protein
MVVDLNRLLLYADAEGRLHDQPVRRLLNIVDGIIGGEGNGPLDPTPKPAGLVLAGENAVAVDFACARLMDFDYLKIPLLLGAFGGHPLPLAAFSPEEVFVQSNADRFCGPVVEIAGAVLAFSPHFGWRGHIERMEPCNTEVAAEAAAGKSWGR